MRVLPPRCLRQRHEDRLNAPARLEAKDGAAIVDEVELDVPAAPHELPLLLLLREGVILVLGHQRKVGGHHRVEALLREGKDGLRVAVVLVVEEDAAEAARLAAVLDREVLVGPLLEARIVLWVVLVADVLVRLVEVRDVLFKEVRWCDVGAAAKPPHAAVRLEVAVVEVHRRRHRVARVHHRREAAREEGNPFARRVPLGAVGATRRRRLQGVLRHRAVHDGEGAARLLEDVAVAEHARDAAAAARPRPHILAELGPVEFGDGFADGVLSPPAVLLESAPHVLVGALQVVVPDERLGRLVDILVRIPADAGGLLLVGGRCRLGE
mmetsp:Transcript_1261/g.3862  ORF Transcript_1261/g.3862 Transcript_1261/m.3862 type:complete len:325 (+) Transcript_1261:225-1199(+)